MAPIGKNDFVFSGRGFLLCLISVKYKAANLLKGDDENESISNSAFI